MIVFLIAIILLVIFIIPIFYKLKSKGDMFCPEVITSILHIITIIPYLISIGFSSEVISPHVRFHNSFDGANNAIIKYAIIQSIAFISLQLSLYFPKLRIKKGDYSTLIMIENKKNINKSFYFSFILGIIGYVILFYRVGGLTFFINNIQRRSRMLSGNGYILTLTKSLGLSVLFYIYSLKYKEITKIRYLNILLILLVAISLNTLLGGRKGTLHILIFSLLVYNYGVNRIKRIPFRTILVISIIILYFIAIPLLRAPNAIENYSNNKQSLVTDIKDNIAIIVNQTSYVDHYLLIINYFNTQNLWLGKSYLDLIYAPIPSSIYPDKPPVDDGVYLRTIANGIDVEPNTPFKNLYPSSWPPETLGIMYMNFLLPGVIIGMFLLGRIYKFVYLYMIKTNYSLFSIIIYGQVILNLELSNLRLVQTVMSIAFYFVFFSVSFKLRFVNINNKDTIYKK